MGDMRSRRSYQRRPAVVVEALVSAPDARAFFLLGRQKKEAKEKATPALRGRLCRLPCATRTAGRLRNSGLRPSDSPRRLPPAVLRCSALHEGANTEWNLMRLGLGVRSVFILPVASSSSARRNGKKGEDCLRGAAPSSAALPLRLSSAEHPAKPGDAVGATFLCLLSFGKTKESNAARQARNPTPQKTPT